MRTLIKRKSIDPLRRQNWASNSRSAGQLAPGVEQEPGVGGQIHGIVCCGLCELPELASGRHGEL
jgi:hypothetical protein